MLRGIQSLIAANENLTLAGLLLTMYDDTSSISQRVAEHVRRNLPRGMVFETMIPRTSGAVEAFAAGQPVVLRDPADPAAQAYTALARELADIFR
jgi:chromosome partitioning protein